MKINVSTIPTLIFKVLDGTKKSNLLSGALLSLFRHKIISGLKSFSI